MKFTLTILIGVSASLARADWGPNGFGGNNWGNWKGGPGPECAKSCFSSAFPDQSTAWSSACASQTAIDNCVSSACPTASAQYSSASSIRSEWCSSYSSCSTASDSCTTAWPWWNGAGGDGWVGGWGGKGPGQLFSNVYFRHEIDNSQAESLPLRLPLDRPRASRQGQSQ
ncbi:hypothetical protein BKA65DRAFT_104445 [Rhexocercosporidium sp. MPI-PUGE-AT-0058]|nr:hypothetical protein BKA65DRAFT_104445 [Rhexocercosporidium sp. MPI-PUGE-AT-0058]